MVTKIDAALEMTKLQDGDLSMFERLGIPSELQDEDKSSCT